ncbi:MAG: hypothetical protein H0X44_02025 [Acidobacteria bacterium]|nr:hypothetical protein [Acidobacteriota bacterium]
MEWRLFSPSAKPLSCEIRETAGGYVLRVSRGGALLFTARAPDTGPLRARAAAWRESLEASGYTPVAPIHSIPGGRSSELRSALRGLIECASVLAMHDAAAARVLRDHATTGLAAVSLRDAATLTGAIAGARAALSRMTGATSGANDFIASCHALIDRIDLEAAQENSKAD